MYSLEKQKKRSDPTKKSAQKVTDIVNETFGTNLSSRTVTHYCQKGMAGQSPIGKGPEGNVPDEVLKQLVQAFESYVRINQNNGDGQAILRKSLLQKVYHVVEDLYPNRSEPSTKLLDRVLNRCNIDLT